MAPILMDDDSDDDLPLCARPKPTAGAAGKKGGDDSSEDEPNWMKSFKSPQQIVDDLDESSSDDDIVMTSPGKTFEMTSTPAKVVKSPEAVAGGQEEEDDDDGDDKDDRSTGAVSMDDLKPPTITKSSSDVPSGNASGATAGVSEIKTPNRHGELPLFMPANVNRSKVLFECEGIGEAVDLEGDVGVVGRLLSDNSDKSKSGLQVDLKGVIYNARVLPTPASIVILAVSQTEAKVEFIANDYVQLREDPHANMGGGTLDGYLGVDSDDEDHQVLRAAAGEAAAAAVRGMDDVSDSEDRGGKRKRGTEGRGAKGKVQKLGADGGRKKAAKPAKKPKKKPKKSAKKK